MLLSRRRPVPLARPRAMAMGLTCLVTAALLPASFAVAAAPDNAKGLQPTIHYEDALEHENDRIAFTAGDKVTVPFTPRKHDTWKVDGKAPRALPAGRQSGKAMRDDAKAATPGKPDGSAPTTEPMATPESTSEATPEPTTAPTTAPSAGPDSSPAASEAPSEAPSDAPVDQPAVDPADTVPASGASWSMDADANTDLAARVDPGGLRREVFGFLPYWNLGDSTTRFDWEKISTVAYFGVGADGSGNLMKTNSKGTTLGWSGWTSSAMTSVINAAHANGARVVLTVQSFAWKTAGLARQKALLGSTTARANLAAQIVKAVRDRGADGVNLDFEPLASGYAEEFTALVRKVRSSLNAAAPGYQLTFDTTGYIGNYPLEAATASGGADAILIMGYDYRTASSSRVGSIAPIGGPSYDIRDTIKAYTARVPASKLILGVPYYGRAWSTSTSSLNSTNISGMKNGYSEDPPYTVARALAAEHGRRYDTVEGVAWTVYKKQTCTDDYGCVTTWRQLYYDDATALKAKYDLINGYNLRGAGIWALGNDGTRTELYQALEDKFITDTVPPAIKSGTVSPTAFSPNGDGVADTTKATLSATGLTKYGWTVQPVSGSTVGASVRSGSKSGSTPSFTWDGRNGDGAVVKNGSYRITLWAADASDNRSEKAFAVTLDTTKAAVGSTISRGFVSPDGNGIADTLPLTWSSNEAITGKVRIFDKYKRTVRSWSFTSDKSWATSWNGRNSSGSVVSPGTYTYRVYGLDRAGNTTVVDKKILADSTIKMVSWSDTSIDPRDGRTSRVTVTLRRSARVTMAIYQGSTLIRRVWTDKALTSGSYRWTWNGKTSAGAYVKPGTYGIRVTAKSAYGTTWLTRNIKIEVH